MRPNHYARGAVDWRVLLGLARKRGDKPSGVLRRPWKVWPAFKRATAATWAGIAHEASDRANPCPLAAHAARLQAADHCHKIKSPPRHAAEARQFNLAAVRAIGCKRDAWVDSRLHMLIVAMRATSAQG